MVRDVEVSLATADLAVLSGIPGIPLREGAA